MKSFLDLARRLSAVFVVAVVISGSNVAYACTDNTGHQGDEQGNHQGCSDHYNEGEGDNNDTASTTDWTSSHEHSNDGNHDDHDKHCNTDTPPNEPAWLTLDAGCANQDVNNGKLQISVKNPNQEPVTYTVTAGSDSANVTVAAGETETVTFTDLSAITYTVTAVGDDGTTASNDITLNQCPTLLPPTVVVTPVACVAADGISDSIVVTVTNPNPYTLPYTVTVAGSSQDVLLDPGVTQDFTFDGLSAGTYTVTVALSVQGLNIDSSASVELSIQTCPSNPDETPTPDQPTPPANSGGHVLGASTTTTTPAATTAPAADPITQPQVKAAELTNTGLNLYLTSLIALFIPVIATCVFFAKSNRTNTTTSSK